jgi:hypothetical protein
MKVSALSMYSRWQQYAVAWLWGSTCIAELSFALGGAAAAWRRDVETALVCDDRPLVGRAVKYARPL